ncbi:MAG: flavin reductase family protein [Acidimicrobiales bacterium]
MTPIEQRDPQRQFRGHLAAPVTVWTAYSDAHERSALTVSSILLAEGDPPSVLGLVGPLTDFWEAVRESKRFVVHILSEDQGRIGDQCAGLYPGLDSAFEGLSVRRSEWGPVLDAVGRRAFCHLHSFLDIGYSILARGEVGRIEHPTSGEDPLVRYRSEYFGIRPRQARRGSAGSVSES